MSREITKDDIAKINIDVIDANSRGTILFHGGCHGCTQQQLNGIRFCTGCQYFAGDWALEDLNNAEPSYSDVVREAIACEDTLGKKVLNLFRIPD